MNFLEIKMKYIIQKHNEEEKEVTRETYLTNQHKAGYYIGDYETMSFYDPQHDLKGWIKDERKTGITLS